MMCNSSISSCTSTPSSFNYTYGDATHHHAVTHVGPASPAGTDYVYNANGDMVRRGTDVLAYDMLRRLISVTNANGTTTFVYDGDGGRVKKVNGPDTFIYIGKLFECRVPCKITDNNNNTVWSSSGSKHIFGGSARIAIKPVTTTGTEINYFHSDHLGSSSVITDQTGAKVADYAYLPYGDNLPTSGTDFRYKYTGQEKDVQTGLYFYNARYYDPVLGRFISADIIISNPRNPQAFNRYSYVMNGPLNYNDPSGHWRIGISFHYFVGGDISYDFHNGHFRGGAGVGMGGGVSVGNGNWDIGASNEWYVDGGYDNKLKSSYVTAKYGQGIQGPSGSMHGWGASGTYYEGGEYQIGGGVGYAGVGVNAGYSSFGKGSWSLGGTILQAGATYDYGTKKWNYSYTIDKEELKNAYYAGVESRQYNGYGAEGGNKTFNYMIDWLGTVMAGWVPADHHDKGYGTPGASKAAIDFGLFTDMMAGAISNTFETNGLFRAAVGLAISPLYYGAVTAGGGPAFREGQRGAAQQTP